MLPKAVTLAKTCFFLYRTFLTVPNMSTHSSCAAATFLTGVWRPSWSSCRLCTSWRLLAAMRSRNRLVNKGISERRFYEWSVWTLGPIQDIECTGSRVSRYFCVRLPNVMGVSKFNVSSTKPFSQLVRLILSIWLF